MLGLHEHYAAREKLELFEALKPQLIQESNESYREIAERLSYSEIAVKVAAHRMRQKYRELLFELIGQTVETKSQVDQEIADLFAALGRS
jgi:hypothetical protein